MLFRSTLSGGSISAATVDYILWELPLSIGWQLYHSALVQNGAKTVKAGHGQLGRYHELQKQLFAKKE